MTTYIEKTVSNLIEKDFPDYYREEGPVFVEFVKKYYEWMESSNNVLYHARRLMEYGDVDDTVDSFIVYFKEKYLKNIQFETQTNTRQLVKHTLDLYRSKGTERSVALLFALVFGESADVYYPGDDIFRLSDGSWVKPKYLEVSNREENLNFVGKQVVGSQSGATAFVERLIRRKIRSKYIDIFYISAINGNFIVDEKLIYSGADIKDCPFMIGSLTTLDIVDGSRGFAVGDIVDITSNNGVQGKGRVANVSNVTGIVSFNLSDGGWGFSANADVLVSENVLTISNVQITNTAIAEPFKLFDTLTQPSANISYEYANGTFANSDIVENYFSNGMVSGQGRVLTVSTTNSTAGVLTISILSGNMASNTVFYKQGNTITANISASGYTDTTTYANIMAWSSNLEIRVTNATANFVVGESVFQYNTSNVVIASAVVSAYTPSVGSNGTLLVTSANGVFRTTLPLVSNSSTANLSKFETSVGVITTNGTFLSTNGNYVYTSYGNTTGSISRISGGSGATFAISNTLLNSETVTIGTDFIRDYANVALNATAYGLTGNVTANLSSIIGPSLGTVSMTIGTISALTSENPGSDYDTTPFILVYEPYVYMYGKNDFLMHISNTSSDFSVGEIITQDTTGATAIVKENSNTSVLYLKRIKFENTFQNNYSITGERSAATAYVNIIVEDETTLPIGINAIITSNVITGNGYVTDLRVFDSGFGYVQNETATFTSSDGERSGTVRVNLLNQGQSQGYYRSENGFLSAGKKLHDGYYYQEYSYEVISSVTLDKYSDMLKQIIHVAGTKFFGGFTKKSEIETNINLVASEREIS